MNTAFDSISIKIASPDQIKDESKQTSCRRRNPAQATDGPFICPEKGTCSCGEVKKAETINYRSFRPEPEGLFCEAIFGPQKDWECNCGKYKRIKHKGMICDRCGVEITQQRVRRDRLGYIQLAAPVSHIWYFKGIPSRIGTFCELSSRDVERVLYFEGFIAVEVLLIVTKVSDPDCPLKVGDLVSDTIGEATLSNVDYQQMQRAYSRGFEAEIPYRVERVPECPFKIGDEISVDKYSRERKRYPGLTAEYEVQTADIDSFTADKCHFHSQPEKEIYEFLSDHGYKVASQVKVDTTNSSDYRLIDLAIGSGNPEEYCLGIEFDGPHHDQLDQKVKDQEKQEELETLGWKIHRIYYKDWDNKREETELELLEAIKNAEEEKVGYSVKGGSLTETEWEGFYKEYPDLKPEFLWNVTKVFDSECPLKIGQNLSDSEYRQALKDYPGLKKGTKLTDTELIRHHKRWPDESVVPFCVVTKTPSPCPHTVGDYISEAEYTEAQKDYPDLEASISCSVEPRQVLTEIEYIEHWNKCRDGFRAGTGAEVIREILSGIDLDEEIKKLTEELAETTSHQKKLKVAKQLKQMADFAEIGQRPEWMILDVIPVIPPDLRPLVPLEGGRFATSDLNDLYRRVINRNNRLRKLIQLRSPEVILRNEKRMLQEAVDAFFDNGRHGRRVTGPGNRPLKSLADVLKGKIGRFRQNLLGKRVDYSGRSVIVVGPELGLHQCGIPKRMAVELFKPFIIERLQAYGHTQTIKRAKHIAEHVDSDSPVWEVVEEVIADHPVLLNRPPTLHRLGIQAFLPVLVEGKSIRIPPLVCKAFNADFDGDQMAVHVPLTVEAQAEAKLLMLSSHNILKPSHGDPIAVPELDMVLGSSFLTKELPEHAADATLLHEAYTTSDPSAFDALREKPWFHRRYTHREEAITAHAAGQLKLHDSLQLFLTSNEDNGKTREPILTTVGRVIFNEVLPPDLEWEDTYSQQELPFFNAEAGGRALSDLIHRCFNELGTRATTEVLEKVQKLAFEYATLSGISPGITDYIIPGNRNELVSQAQAKIANLLGNVAATEREEHENEQIRIWFDAIAEVEDEMFLTLPEEETPLVERGDSRKVHPYVDPNGLEVHNTTVKGFSPVHIMADSGARARKNPFMQISAIIGLKAKQDGTILTEPIKSSYREGLSVLDYFNSTYGSRKGLVDTAMKTAASGYLTRKLVDVAQDVRVTTEDCGTLNSIQKFATEGGDLAFKISGRTAAEDILNPESGNLLVPSGTVISAQMADQIDALGISVVQVRSVLTCQTDDGICAKCYGNDLTTNDLVNVGEAVGIIAAQSIGEPGTQLTMRTFHTGGAVEDVSEARQRRILSKANGTVHFRDFQPDQTVEKEGELWVAIENRANLDGPAYKVQQVNHPHCQLRQGELLSEKQYTENAERYKGFDTKTWLYEVTAVLDRDCNLQVGDRLSQAEYVKAQIDYGFQRFVTPKYRVSRVQHPKLSLTVGTELTEAEIEQLRADTRQGIDGEWHYLDAETGERIAIESLTTNSNQQSAISSQPSTDSQQPAADSLSASFNRVYCITEIDPKTSKDFGFKVGDEVAPGEIAPLLNPFEVEAKPVYAVHTEVNEFTVGQTLTAREYEDARTEYQHLERAFKVEKQDVERYYVTAVYHAECPLETGEELNASALARAHRRFTGFDAQRLRHRITQVYHPDCPLKPGDLISENEAKQFDENYPGFVTSQSTSTAGGFEAERLYRVTSVNHSDCPLEVGELLTQKESSANRRHYKGFEVSRHYEVTHIEDGTTAFSLGQRLTEIEYKALRKTDASLPEKVKGLYHVVSVHHPELDLEVGTELSEEEYRTYHRQFKGFDAELVYRITEDSRDIDERLELGTILPSKEYRALDRANLQVTHTVTEVYHPNCKYAAGDELPDAEYNEAAKRYPGFDVDELALRMRIEVETADGNRVPHVIPTGYSFSLTEGDSIQKGETLAELHERTANLDIVAGIPRVTELFEARRPKRGEAAEIAEIEGYVRSAGTKAGIPTYRIEHEGHQSRLYQIPDEKRRVAADDWVNAGEPLTDGYLNPHDILSIGRTTIEGVSVEGDEAVWAYLVDEVQKVYGTGTINDKHVETIVRQMLTKIRITEPGDTNFYPNDEVQRRQFERVNGEIEEKGGVPATGAPILQSISKASLSTDSFISAASFQQTTKVLTDAAVSGQTDKLFGLKENVILGRLIPAGSGFSSFQNLEVSAIESEISESGDDD